MGELEITAMHLLWPQKNPCCNHKMREGNRLAPETFAGGRPPPPARDFGKGTDLLSEEFWEAQSRRLLAAHLALPGAADSSNLPK